LLFFEEEGGGGRKGKEEQTKKFEGRRKEIRTGRRRKMKILKQRRGRRIKSGFSPTRCKCTWVFFIRVCNRNEENGLALGFFYSSLSS
jgi:hypothetical protein